MASDGSPSGSDEPVGPRLSWIERERMQALQRLANARSNLAELEEKAGGPAARLGDADPADLTQVDAVYAEIAKLRPKAEGRFGGAAARERIEELELEGRLVLERLNFGSYEALKEERTRPVTAASDVDPVVLDFARREYQAAEQAFFEVAAIDIVDDDTADDEDDEDDGGSATNVVDLRPPRPAAS